MVRGGYIYITTNKSNTVLYTGITSNLKVRIYEHKSHAYFMVVLVQFSRYLLRNHVGSGRLCHVTQTTTKTSMEPLCTSNTLFTSNKKN